MEKILQVKVEVSSSQLTPFKIVNRKDVEEKNVFKNNFLIHTDLEIIGVENGKVCAAYCDYPFLIELLKSDDGCLTDGIINYNKGNLLFFGKEYLVNESHLVNLPTTQQIIFTGPTGRVAISSYGSFREQEEAESNVFKAILKTSKLLNKEEREEFFLRLSLQYPAFSNFLLLTNQYNG